MTARTAAAATLAALAIPGSAPGAVTIGSDLSKATGTARCDATSTCTIASVDTPGRPMTAPTDGVIVRWRTRDSTGTLALRVVREAQTDRWVAAGTSPQVTLTSPQLATFEGIRLPVRAGDRIAVDLAPRARMGARTIEGGRLELFDPALVDNAEARAPTETVRGFDNQVNADIEPDADRDGFGDETQDLCAKDAKTQGLCGGPCANDRPGGPGDDTPAATVAGDRVLGFAGNDVLNGLAGDDCLDGGAGNDRLTGDVGADRLLGGVGDDLGDGGAGNDVLGGGPGNDLLLGGADRDRLVGEAGEDRLDGGAGNDRIEGGPGDDRLAGGAGRDRLVGGSGVNRLSGGGGDDDLRAVNGRRDRIVCGAGRDVVRADRRDRVARDCERVRRG